MKKLLTWDDHGYDPIFYTASYAPSVATIRERLGVDEETAREVRAILKGTRDVFCYQSAVIRQRNAYNPHDALTLAFEALNELLDGFGVEYIQSSDDTFTKVYGLEYVNKGDTYSVTLLYDHTTERWECCSWGDIVECFPRRFE